MTWATERRLVIGTIFGALVIALLLIILVPTISGAPSCGDDTQNQGEDGVDCGGPCAYLCTPLVQAPVIRFTKAVSPQDDRIDVVAFVDNQNVGIAARAVPYTITLYDANQEVLKTETGKIDLPPARSVPIFIPGVYRGVASTTRAFLEINTSQLRWFNYSPATFVPSVSNPSVGGTITEPRITATLTNPRTVPTDDVRVVAIIYDASGTVIAASQTVIPPIPPEGNAEALFTWGAPFSATPARIEVVPVPTFPKSP